MTEDQHLLSTAQQVPDLITNEFIAVCAILNPTLYRTRSGPAILVSQSAIVEATIAPDVLGCVALMPKDPPPSINQLLSDGWVIRSCRTKVAIVPAIADHLLFHRRCPSLLDFASDMAMLSSPAA
jgi:hypothetical protein